MPGHSVGRTVIVHKDGFAYNAPPSIAVLDNCQWLAGFGNSRLREPRMPPPGDPLFRTLLTRSSDRGETWAKPYFAPDFDWSGVEPPGIRSCATAPSSSPSSDLAGILWVWPGNGELRASRSPSASQAEAGPKPSLTASGNGPNTPGHAAITDSMPS